MLDFLYTLFIAPLEYWMHAALVWGYGKTANWGEAVFIMSLVVNFVILPIYMKAEKWQEDERALRKSFEEKEKMIKRTFKGQERFAMISTMQRQAGYSPLLTLRSSVGFFLQVPFFFAAYHFLSHFEPLAGVSFLGLPDLSKPDGLIHLGGFSVNVMPFVMTVINLASALVYTKNLTQKDKNQLYAMAALFLVLLYDAASGLVLYWTCNNIFSFAKNVCYDLAERVKLSERLSAAGEWIRAYTARENEVCGSAFFAGAVLVLWAAATVLALMSSNQMDLIDEVTQAGFSRVSDGLYLAALVCAVVEALRLKLWQNHRLLLVFTLFSGYYIGRIWYKYQFIGSNRHNLALQAGLLILIIGVSLWNIRRPLKDWLYPMVSPAKLFVGASVWLVILMTGYLPLQAFSTAPEAFSTPDVVIAKSLLWTAVFGVVLWATYHLTRLLNTEKGAGMSVGLTAVFFTVYAFLLPLNVGTIDAFQIAEPAPLYSAQNLLMDAAVFAGVTMGFLWLLRRGFVTQMAKVFGVLSCIGILAGIAGLWQSQGGWHTKDEVQTAENGTQAKLPDWTQRFFGFSKDHTNTVIVMFDAFSGGHMRQIIDEMPDVTAKLTGFTWYTDAMASGNNTISSVATIFGGRSASVGEINKGPSVSVAEKINASYADTVMALDPKTDVSFNERNWLEPARLRKNLIAKGWQGKEPLAIRFVGESFLDRWVEKTGEVIGRGESDMFLLAVSVFKAVPWSFKNMVYKDGRWIDTFIAGADRQNTLTRRAQSDWAFLSLLPEMSNVDQSVPTVKFMDTEITHSPWKMELGRCKIVAEPKDVLRPNGVHEAHLALERCALKAMGDWFDWMKANGVYENTNIILISDHGGGDTAQMIAGLGSHLGEVGRPDSLFLFKPAGKTDGAIEENPAQIQISNVGEWLRGAKLDEHRAERLLYAAKPTGTQYKVEAEWLNTGKITEWSSWKRLQ